MELLRFFKKGKVRRVRLSDLKETFADQKAVARLLQKNPTLYSVSVVREKGVEYALTKLRPGKIGKERFMTKGHYHRLPVGELYLLLSGKGVLVLQKAGRAKKVQLRTGIPYYVEPETAHRVVNVGNQPLTFLCVYPAEAGHEYQRVKREGGFKIRILK